MRTFRKTLLSIFIVIAILTAYAHFIHPILFFGKIESQYASGYKSKGEPITFKSGEYTLSGQLITPQHISGKIPVIIFCVGSGSQSSYTNSYYRFLDSLLEQNLPTDSIAILYFDKRGVGKSDGKWYNTSFEQRAEDVKAAADYLKSLPYIDSSRIAIIGHSQGGWITQICLAKYPETFSGGVSMAGPTFNVKEQIINDYTSMLMCKEKLGPEKARERARNRVNLEYFITSLLPLKEDWWQLNVIRSFEPAQYLSNIKKPLLLMFAENDALVSPQNSIATLNSYFPDGYPANIQTKTIGGANHSFKMAELCYDGPNRNRPYSEEAKKELAGWVRTFLLK